MGLFDAAQREFAECISAINYANPFKPDRLELERRILGSDCVDVDSAWTLRADAEGHHPNIDLLTERNRQLLLASRQKLLDGTRANASELELYEDMAINYLYHRFYDPMRRLVESAYDGGPREKPGFYNAFLEEYRFLMEVPDVTLPRGEGPEKIFAFLFQIRRAFFHIYNHIVGNSRPIMELRANVWRSICTRDARRYRRALHMRMGDISTLIVGPSGTGKELVARAIGLARFVPFSAKKGDFEEDFVNSFHPLSLPALASTLIESELFGHCRGAFTGAVVDRCGYLELCEACGTVFLDEIGELEHTAQVKLLRVLQARTFQRLGDTQLRRFRGKIIAATNLDLSAEISAGRFREDLYYRLCSDIIVTPSLRQQLADSPGDLLPLVSFIARQIVPEEAEPIAQEVVGWINAHMDSDYSWPGNFRELEQCVKNVLVRGEYIPAGHARQETRDALAKGLLEGTLTADEALNFYCRLVYEKTGSYVAAARHLNLDRRTVRARLGLPPVPAGE